MARLDPEEVARLSLFLTDIGLIADQARQAGLTFTIQDLCRWLAAGGVPTQPLPELLPELPDNMEAPDAWL